MSGKQPKKFMSQPLRGRRDYGSSDASEDPQTDYDRFGLPVTAAPVIPQRDYDKPPVMSPSSMPLECPYCQSHRMFDPAALKRTAYLICSSCRGEVPVKTIRKTADGYRSMLSGVIQAAVQIRQDPRGTRNFLQRMHPRLVSDVKKILRTMQMGPAAEKKQEAAALLGLIAELSVKDFLQPGEDQEVREKIRLAASKINIDMVELMNLAMNNRYDDDFKRLVNKMLTRGDNAKLQPTLQEQTKREEMRKTDWIRQKGEQFEQFVQRYKTASKGTLHVLHTARLLIAQALERIEKAGD